MDIERRLYLRLVSFCIGKGMDILSFFIDTCVLNHSDFDSFLNLLRNKHKMFHKWLSKTPCCECINSTSIAAPNKGSVLNEAQLKTIYNLDGTEVAGHVIKNYQGHTIQHCLCKVSAIAGITTDTLDIALIHCLIKTCDPAIFSKVGMHIEAIRDVRNKLAHPPQRGIMHESEFNSKWSDVENAVLAIAKEVSTSYQRHAKKLISPLRDMDVNLEDTVEKFDSLEENIKGKLTEILQDHQKINDLIENKAEKIKQDIIKALEKQKDELSIEIQQLTFAVRLHGIEIETTQDGSESFNRRDEDLKHFHGSDENSKQKQSGETHTEKCKVRWRLETPDAWDVEQIKQTLERVSALLSPFFSIEFMYTGSLVIHTSVSRHVLRDRQLVKSAIQSFFEKIVEVCQINTDIKQTVAVEFSVLDMDLKTEETVKSAAERLTTLPQYGKIESSNDEDNVNCKHRNKRFICDQCSDRHKQIKVLEEDIKKKIQTIKDMKTERKRPKSKGLDYHRFLKKKKRLTDSIKTEAKISSEYKQCQLCVSNPKRSVYWCIDCTKTLCQECIVVHRTQLTASTHTVHLTQPKSSIHNILRSSTRTRALTSCDYSYQIICIYINDMASLCQGELIISDSNGQQLITFDIKGNNKQFIQLPFMPRKLTVIDINTVAVTAVNQKKIFIVDVKNKTVTQHIDVNKWCYEIMYKNNNLYVGCIDKSLVVLEMSGEVIRTVSLSFIPRYICSGSEGCIYFSNYTSNSLHCIDTEGNTVFTVTNPGISGPTGITTENKGHVLVVCDKSNNVHRISPDGAKGKVIITSIQTSSGLPSICYDWVSKSIVIARGETISVYTI